MQGASSRFIRVTIYAFARVISSFLSRVLCSLETELLSLTNERDQTGAPILVLDALLLFALPLLFTLHAFVDEALT